ncbi:MAG: transposase [Pyrinomonadaceae bacterium]|nr:transposase [Pyrinomonadaceae bacterium]
MTVVTQILDQMPAITKPQRKFVLVLFATILALRGRLNFRNLARYSTYSERTHHRQFHQSFDFPAFNRRAIAHVTDAATTLLVAQDATFIRKSGKQTYGLDKFWNGCAHRNEKGLELSAIAILDVARRTAYPLSAHQTPPRRNSLKEPSSELAATPQTTFQPEETRIDFYLQHLAQTVPFLPQQVRYAVFDGAFAKRKFVAGVAELDLHLISLLRVDANLRYLYTGAKARRGRPKAFDGKVNFADLSRLDCAGEVAPHITLYTAVVNSVSLKRNIRICVVLNRTKPEKPRRVVLFSTDCELSAHTIYDYYTLRFQIEFLFRDAKQFTGLNDCQARDKEALHFHFNMALAAVGVTKIEELRQHRASQPPVFSLASWKQRAFNEQLLDVFISKLALEPTVIKSHPQYDYLRTYGAIAA